MDTLFIPTENDFKTWIKEALEESLNASVIQNDKVANPQQEY